MIGEEVVSAAPERKKRHTPTVFAKDEKRRQALAKDERRRQTRDRVRSFRDRQKAKKAASFSNFWPENKMEFQRAYPDYYKKLVERHNEIEALEDLVEQVVNDPDASRVAETYAAVMRSVDMFLPLFP